MLNEFERITFTEFRILRLRDSWLRLFYSHVIHRLLEGSLADELLDEGHATLTHHARLLQYRHLARCTL